MTFFHKSKYRNVPVKVDGIRFASKAEARRYCDLELLRKGGQIRGFILQPRFRLGCPENVYVADFMVFENNGTVHVEDVKGVRTRKFERDVKLWKAYGPCDLHIIGKKTEVVTPARLAAAGRVG